MCDTTGILLGIDLSEVFDRVEHSFLWATLKKFGFGPKIVQWIQILFENAICFVKCGGFLNSFSSWFSAEIKIVQYADGIKHHRDDKSINEVLAHFEMYWRVRNDVLWSTKWCI